MNGPTRRTSTQLARHSHRPRRGRFVASRTSSGSSRSTPRRSSSQRPLKAHADLRKRPVRQRPGQPPQPGEVVKELGIFDGVGRDLRESPFAFELDVHDVADGTTCSPSTSRTTRVELGTATLTVALAQRPRQRWSRRLDSRRRKRRRRRCAPTSSFRSIACGTSIAAASSCGRSIPDKDLAAAETVAVAAAGGKNRSRGKTGDFKRHYLLEAAKEIMPYRMYVPTAYNGSKPYPADHRAARTGRDRGRIFRRLRSEAAAARRTARLHRRRRAGLSRRRLVRVGRRQSAGRSRHAARPGIQRTGRDAGAAARAAAVQDRREAHLPDGPLDGRDRHVEDRREVSGHLGGDGNVCRRGSARRSRASSTCPSSSSMATTTRRSTSTDRGRWSRR